MRCYNSFSVRVNRVQVQWAESAELYEHYVVTGALGKPAPALKALHIYTKDIDSPLMINAQLLKHVSIQLTFLKLKSEAIHLVDAPPLPCLRRFEMKGIENDISLGPLSQLLSQAPNLEVLIMINVSLLL